MTARKRTKLSDKHKNNIFIIFGIVAFVLTVMVFTVMGILNKSKPVDIGTTNTHVAAQHDIRLSGEDNKKDKNIQHLVQQENLQGFTKKDTFAPTMLDDLKANPQPDLTVGGQDQYEYQEPDPKRGPDENPMVASMDGLLVAWLPDVPKQIVFNSNKGRDEKQEVKKAPTKKIGGKVKVEDVHAAKEKLPPPDIRIGEILYAEVVTSVNSDEPGPVLLRGLSSKIRGMRLMSRGFKTHELAITINPTTLVTPEGAVQIDAFVVNPKTARTVVASDVDRHFFLRWGSFLATGILADVGSVMQLANTNSQVVTSGLGSVTSNNTNLSTSKEGWVIAGRTAQRLSAISARYMDRPNTIYLHTGEPVGILFMSSVRFPHNIYKSKQEN